MFADDIVLCGDEETDMTEYLETWKKALESRGMRISRPKIQLIDFKLGEDNGQGRESVKILGEELQRVHHFNWSKRGGDRRHGNRNYTESECSMEKLEEMQWSVVCQEDASETEGNGLQNCCQTRYVVWCRYLGNNERTRSTTRSKLLDEDAEMEVRSDREG